MIVVKSNKIEVYYPMGVMGEELIKKVFNKYGIRGEVKEIWCG